MTMQIEKIKEFYLKNKHIIFLPAITLLLFFACYYSPLWIVASVLTFFFYINLNLGELFCYTLYFGMFSGIGTFYITSLLIGFGLMIIRYVYDLIKKQTKFYSLPFVLTTLFVLVFSLINYGYSKSGFEQGVLVVSLLYVAYFVLVYGKTINPDKCFKYLMIGVFASLVLGLLSLVLPGFGFKIYHYDGTYKRLQLFTFYPNHLAVISSFAIAHYVTKIINRQGKLVVNLTLIVCMILIGLFTLSKAFIVLLLIIALYVVVMLIKIYKWKSLKFLIPAVLCLLVVCLCAHELVEKIIIRFTHYAQDENLLYRITTGRSGIWEKYIKDMTSSIPKLLFGVGLFTTELVDIGPHNVPIYFAHRVGLVGLVLLCLLIWSYIRESGKNIKFKLSNCLLFAVFVFIAMEEMIFSDRFFFFLILGILSARKQTEGNDLDKENTKQKKNLGENAK